MHQKNLKGIMEMSRAEEVIEMPGVLRLRVVVKEDIR